MDGSDLVAVEGDKDIVPGADRVGIVATGTYDDIVAGRWQRAKEAAAMINRESFDYKAHDPSFELGHPTGGQIQNSNSVAYTLGRAMGVDVDAALRGSTNDRRFPGWDRDLLDPNYKRYVAPNQFPVERAP